MKLKTLKIHPRDNSGLASDILTFSDHITHIYGPNGCGKTPIIKSIAFCLGYPSKFRNDIYSRCKMASLEIEHEKGTLNIERQFSRDFDIEIIDKNGVRQRFLSEGEFSEFIFSVFDLNYPDLVSNKGTIVKPYISTLLPLIFTDQDSGYTGIYTSPGSFIQDQFQEMIRLLFNLSPKNSFNIKKERIYCKNKLDYLDREVKKKEEELKIAQEVINTLGTSDEEIIEKIKALESELNIMSKENSTKTDSIRAFDLLISQQETRIRTLETALIDIIKRRKSLTAIIEEINSEANALSLNESSRQIFLSFNEICSNSNCGLFNSSSDSYAKNLLYLKDQIKDLTRSDAIYSRDETQIESQILSNRTHIEELLVERNKQENNSDISAIIASVSNLKDQIFDLQLQLSEHNKLDKIKKEYVLLLNKRSLALERYESLQPSRSNTPNFVQIRANLRRSFLVWLDHLHTPSNVSRDITFRNEFEPVMGNEQISQLSGSTKIRVVLAFHAALIENLVGTGSPIKLLILDTPKQHEISNVDLERYFNALKSVCEKGDVQVVFSTTEYRYIGNKRDTTWEPEHEHEGDEQKMFLFKPQ